MVLLLVVLMGGGGLVDHSLESVVVVSGVGDRANGSVGLHQRVLALHNISVTLLVLRLDVSGVVIVDAVLELVLGMGVVVHVLLLLVVVVLLDGLLLVSNGSVFLGHVLMADIAALDLLLVVMAVILFALLLVVSQALVAVVVRRLVVFDGAGEGDCRKGQDDQSELEGRGGINQRLIWELWCVGKVNTEQCTYSN